MRRPQAFSLAFPRGQGGSGNGASYGIGFAIATALAEAGAKIAFNDRRQERIDSATAEYAKRGIVAHGFVADVTVEEQVAGLIEDIRKVYGTTPDILVNNAGIIKRIPMLEMSAADYRQVVDIDLVGPFICAKAVIPGMIEKGHGKIINICSMMSELGRETIAGYAAAKGGLKMLTKNICSEFGEANIQCNGIGPGYIATRRPLPCVSASRTARATRSTSSSVPRRPLAAGARPRTSWDRQSSSPLTPRTS